MEVTIPFAENKYSLYGLENFLDKYGISLVSRNKKPLIHPVSSNHNNKDSYYRGKITGWIEQGDKKLPVFKAPSDLTHKGEALLTYSESNKKYPCAASSNGNIILGLDIFEHIGYCLSGCLEKIWARTGLEKNNMVTIPFADYYGEILFSSLLNAHRTLNLPLVHKAFWPDGKRFAVCLTHDVDEIKKSYQWITYPLRFAVKRDIKGLCDQFSSLMQKAGGKEPFWTFKNVMELEDKLDVRSSFFFLNETGKVKLLDRKTWRHSGRRYSFNDPRVSNVIKELHSKGWDVGLHGSFYSHDDPEKIRVEKEALEDVLGCKVLGIRQHNLNLTVPETWLHHEKAGLKYDTTLGFNRCIGFRWGTCFPFRPFYARENRALDILEIPLVIEDLPFFRYEDPWEEGMAVTAEVERAGGAVTLLWHHSVFNEREFPGWGASYKRIIEDCRRKNAWITSAREIADWWRRRERTSFEWDYDGTVLKVIPCPKEENHFLNIYPPEKTIIKKISNAEVVGFNDTVSEEGMFSIRTDNLEKDEYVRIEFSEWEHGN